MAEPLSCLNSVKIGLKKKKKKTVKNFLKILTKQSVNILSHYVIQKSLTFIPLIKIMFLVEALTRQVAGRLGSFKHYICVNFH